MRWITKEKISDEIYISKWHRWFAWYPVRTINGVTVWLEFVDKKFTGMLTGRDGERIFEYKLEDD